jgi:hypothetical protein
MQPAPDRIASAPKSGNDGPVFGYSQSQWARRPPRPRSQIIVIHDDGRTDVLGKNGEREVLCSSSEVLDAVTHDRHPSLRTASGRIVIRSAARRPRHEISAMTIVRSPILRGVNSASTALRREMATDGALAHWDEGTADADGRRRALAAVRGR